MAERRRRHRGASPLRPARTRRDGPGLAARIGQAMPWVLASVLLSVVLAGAIWLPGLLDQRPIETVKVEGVKDPRRQQEVQLTLSSTVSEHNFFTLSLSRVHGEVGALAWVEDVAVRRQWPDTLVVRIEERVPVVVWNDRTLVSASGETFDALHKYSLTGLPRLSGPEDRLRDVMEYYHGMSRVLAARGLRIDTLDVDARLTARLTLSDGLQLVVDRDGYARKLRAFVQLHESVLAGDSRVPARVDLRYADGMAVQWRDGAQTQKKS